MTQVSTTGRQCERADAHNASVDGRLARAGYCGTIHLCTGRVCIREAHHTGSCEFCEKDDVLSRIGVAPDPSH